MATDEANTNIDWLQVERDVERLFSSAPLSPADLQGHGRLEALYPGRASEVRLLMRAVRDPAKHILLYGERGLGKTSLANTFWMTSHTPRQPILVARMQVHPFDDFSSLWLRALDEFQSINVYEPKPTLIDPTSVSPEIIRRELQKVPSNVTTIIIVDEFDQLQDNKARELTAHLLKFLHDHAVNATVLLIGVAENVEELIVNHQSLRRVLSLVKLERMNASDLNEILDSRLRLTPLRLCDEARSELVALSCGLPYYTQTLGKLAALNAINDHRDRINVNDIDAAIESFLVESGQSFSADYERAIESQQPDNIFCEVILACALADSDAGGVVKPAAVAKTLNLVMPNKSQPLVRIQHCMSLFASDRRGKILTRAGKKGDYRYRFSDALMRPFIIIRSIKDHTIDENSRGILFRSHEKGFRDAGYRLGIAEAYVAHLGMVPPTESGQ